MTDKPVEEKTPESIMTVFGQVLDDGSIRIGNQLAEGYNMHQSMFEALSIGVASQLLNTLKETYSPLVAPLMRETVTTLREQFPREEDPVQPAENDKQDALNAIAKKADIVDKEVDDSESVE